MTIIPKLSGPVQETGGRFAPALPLSYAGDCPFADQFPMAPAAGAPALTFVPAADLPPEGYRLKVSEQAVVLEAADRAGCYYGLQTLFQELSARQSFPCGVFQDAPRFPFRSFMLDVSRHFFPLEEVKKVVDQCAKLKLNTFHWHLSDDQGYRIESKKFPKLNEIGSHRDQNGPADNGYYTQEEIRELVAFADARCIQVIPEIDLPGHTSAITAAYPELSCSGEPGQVQTGAGIFPRILCGGEEKVYAFLKELLAEVAELFPAPYFHIGGDEAPKAEWEKCPKCQAMMKLHGLQNEEELQAHFTAVLADLLEAQGKTVLGWNEILASGKMKPSAIAQYWTDHGAAYSAREVPLGRRFVFSNVSSFYLDYDPAIITLQGVYSYEPMIPGGQAIAKEQILGLEAPLWTEFVETPERLEELVFPRLAALAENAWTREKDWADFLTRLPACYDRWQAEGVQVYPWQQSVLPQPTETAQALLQQFHRWMDHAPAQAVRDRLLALVSTEQQGPNPLLSPTFTPEEQAAIGQEFARLVHQELD